MTVRCLVPLGILSGNTFKKERWLWLNQDAGYYVALVIFEKQQDVKVVQIWINLSGLIAALLKPVANPKSKIIVENVIVLSVLCSILLLMIWNRATMA